MKLLTKKAFEEMCIGCSQHYTRMGILFTDRWSANRFLQELAHKGGDFMENHGIKRYMKDFGIEFKNGSRIMAITCDTENVRGRRYESLFYPDECVGVVSDEIMTALSSFETGRPTWHWKTVAPSWCEELTVYSVSDLGEMDTADVSVLFA